MVTLRISNDSYSFVRGFLARTLDAEMFDGEVQDWDGDLYLTLRALVEMDLHADVD